MIPFNDEKTFHGSEKITQGKLTGQTDTDYFYFFCPECEGKQILRILDMGVILEQPTQYTTKIKPQAAKEFTVAFKLSCPKCHLTDFVKVSNLGWQEGNMEGTPCTH